MKLPMVFWDAKPTAAAVMAETETIQSDVTPLTRLINAMPAIKIMMRKANAKLFATLGSSLVRFAKRERYRVRKRSMDTAIATMTIMYSTVESGIPKMSVAKKVGVGEGTIVGVGVTEDILVSCNANAKKYYNSFEKPTKTHPSIEYQEQIP